jgi:hypothetical protein
MVVYDSNTQCKVIVVEEVAGEISSLVVSLREGRTTAATSLDA